MATIFIGHPDLSEQLSCSWGNEDNLYLLKKDLSKKKTSPWLCENFQYWKSL